ncbi:MAG: cation:proton antiporter [Salinivirgaceae bacterium]|jgi:CPA2 family monovalent cation:H+ antiporter-2|nr:cation:proton antiporter [Salinivirgaceae bacterium]
MVFLAAAVNQSVINLVIVGFVIMLLGFLLKKIKQPLIIAYILAGVLVGPSGFGLINDLDLIEILGELGLILLLFFIGMEISLPNLVKMWKTALFGVLFQVMASIFIVWIIGYFFSWGITRIIVLGFILSLSSSAVIIKLLKEKNELNSTIGQNVLSILLMQDMVIVPMLLITEFLGGEKPTMGTLALQIVGAIAIVALFIYIVKKKSIRFPFANRIKNDHEAQVFVAILFCFGFAILTGFLGLSAALGAFFAGILVHATDSIEWIHDSLRSFQIIFVSMFFVSIGMLIDLNFLMQNYIVVLLLLISVYITNHFINTLILHFFCRDWRNSFYGGAMLAQVGELGFIILASAYYYGSITSYTYQLVILTISLTLLISPFWIQLAKWLSFRKHPFVCPKKE